jgi:hypothetical protein
VIKTALGDLQQLRANSTALSLWQHVQLIDPALPKGNHSDHRGAIESTPNLARPEHALPEEPLIFFWSMEFGQRR